MNKLKKHKLKLTGKKVVVPISRCFRCDGSGQICQACGETENHCHCDPDQMNMGDCPDCKGTGK